MRDTARKKLWEWRKIKAVPEPAEIIETAFKRASKKAYSLEVKGSLIKIAKAREKTRLKIALQNIDEKLSEITEDFSQVLSQEKFYLELTDALIGCEKLKKCMEKIGRSRGRIRRICLTGLKRLSKAEDPGEAERIRRTTFGKIATVVKRLKKTLTFLNESREKLSSFPSLEIKPSIVVAGYPIVGKSTFVKNVSTASPKIDIYPFTTRKIIVGVSRDLEGETVQVIDTPGLLDRPLSKRNPIEKQGIAALKHLAGIIIFMVDPTETCGYKLDEQLRLLKEVRNMFSSVDIIPVANKKDLVTELGREAFSKLVKKGFLPLKAIDKDCSRKVFQVALKRFKESVSKA